MKTLRWFLVLFFAISPALALFAGLCCVSWKLGVGLLVVTAWITTVLWAWNVIDKEYP